MRNITIPRKYAKALFELAREKSKVEEYMQDLEAFESFLAGSEDLQRIVHAPLHSKEKMKQVISTVADFLGLDYIIRNFLLLLVNKARLRYIFDIIKIYKEFVDEEKGIARACVTAAFELSEGEIRRIKEALQKFSGKKVIIDANVDENILGGITIQMGDIILDGSLKTQLARMKKSMIEQR